MRKSYLVSWLALGAVAVGFGVVACGNDTTAGESSTPDAGPITTTPVPPPPPPPAATDAGVSCGPGITACGGACTDVKVDRNHCGGCDTKCGAGEVCSDGACGATCGGATPNLCGTGDNARCVAFASDPNNCGSCDTKCAPGATCSMGDGGSGNCSCPAGTGICGTGAATACVPNALCASGQYLADCTAIHLADPTALSGPYTIDPDGAGAGEAFKVYCDMTTEGGGWTLTLKADNADTGGAAGANRFEYDAATWTTTTAADPLLTFNTTSADLSRASAKLASFNSVPFDQIRVAMSESAAAPRGLSLSVPNQTSMQAMFAGGQLDLSINRSRAQWTGLLDTPRLEPNCNLAGVNVAGTADARSRIGILGNDANDCASPDSYVGIGNGGIDPAACGTANLKAVVGSAQACAGAGSTGADGTTSAFAWVFVRRTSFTSLAAQATCAAHYALGRTISGTYTIDPDGAGGTDPYHVYCDMNLHGGGWTMVHKFVDGVASTDPYAVYTGGTELNAADDAYLGVLKNADHYLNRVVTTDWNTAFTVNEARVSVWNGETESAFVRFSAPGSTATNFFALANMTGSSWTDLTGGNFFSAVGETTVNFTRRWFINANYGGCGADTGWLTVTAPGAGGGCGWETVYARPSILFSKVPLRQNWTSGMIGHGDTFTVFVR
jgi:hypothetical protein